MITENIVLSRDFSWIDIEHPLRSDQPFIKQEFGLPPLLVQDCLRPEQLPKYEKTQRGFFFLVRLYDPSSQKGNITIQQLTNKLSIFITETNIITIHYDIISPLRKFTEMRDKHGFPRDVRELTHQLLRITIMSFEEALLVLQQNYEEFERQILSSEIGLMSNKRVYEFRRKLYVIKGALDMTQRALYNSKDFWAQHRTLQQDLRENIDQLYFRLDGLSHSFDQLFALHLSINEHKNNDVIKVLTIFASIMLPLTFIASFYGMNFQHLPGIRTTSGFVGSLLIMATTTFITIWFFSKKHWFSSSM